MIPRIAFFILAAFRISFSFAQTIDSLKTDEQVLAFVRGLKMEYKTVSIIPPKPIIGSLDYKTLKKQFGSTAYEKADFDGNGQTDLLFNGYKDDYEGNSTCDVISFVALSFGKDSFLIKEFTHGPFIEFFAARVLPMNGHTYVRTQSIKSMYNYRRKTSYFHKRTDTLTYVFDEFVEKSKAINVNIEKIEFCAFGGMGFGGMNLTIIDSLAILQTGEDLRLESVFDSGGTFQANLDPYTLSKIFGILKYIDFLHLKSSYAVSWTDDLEGTLRVTYDHGKIKKVNDYGLIGTYGLAAVQQLFFELKTSQHWEKTTPLQSEVIYCRP